MAQVLRDGFGVAVAGVEAESRVAGDTCPDPVSSSPGVGEGPRA